MPLREKIEISLKYLYQKKQTLLEEIEWIDRCIDVVKNVDKK